MVRETHGVKEVISPKGDTTFIYQIEKNPDIAKNLKGRLLLVTGDVDNNVHPAHTIRMANALIKANKRFDFIILPSQRHGFGDMTEYFFWRRGTILFSTSWETIPLPLWTCWKFSAKNHRPNSGF